MSGQRHEPEKTCPNQANHTPHPTSYLAHGEWAEGMLTKGYRQVKCSWCGLYAIWLPPVESAGHRWPA